VTALRIGTRGSQLALWQAQTVARLIGERGGPPCEIVIIRTSGDERPSLPLDAPPQPPSAINVKATFVKEIEDALLEGRVDLAVHSSKDLAAVFPEGLAIGATLPREDARDAVLLPNNERVESLDALRTRLGRAPRIGTSSVRRAAQLAALLPGASFAPIRGNVDTRLRKIDDGQCDAGVLAVAGLKRLGLGARISFALPLDVCVPAPGQGIVTVQVREDERDVQSIVATINDAAAFDALTAERTIVRLLGGGCQMPLGAYAEIDGDELVVVAVVTAPAGSRVVRARARGARTRAADLGARVAESLLQDGAANLL
jgi:hydroxymethylbilane synthase